MTRPRFSVSAVGEAAPDDAAAVRACLRDFNVAMVGDPQRQPVSLLVRDAHGATVGGLIGRIGYGWLFVELLGLPEAARGAGLGTRLMAEAESIARAAGCVGIWLDTYDFQARGFYERLGFEEFGTIADYPPGHSRHFMLKRF